MKIVTNKSRLRTPTVKCDSVEEGQEIAKKLVNGLSNFGGIGLAANQIGINKSVCVVDARDDAEAKVLINPRVVEASEDKIVYVEGCLSLPGKTAKTLRHKTIKVACDNWENEIEFGPDGELTKENFWKDKGLLECVCIQHEIGHLDGDLITDSHIRYKEEPIRVEKFGRNEKVMLSKDGETKFVKYKKAEPFLEDGWVII